MDRREDAMEKRKCLRKARKRENARSLGSAWSSDKFCCKQTMNQHQAKQHSTEMRRITYDCISVPPLLCIYILVLRRRYTAHVTGSIDRASRYAASSDAHIFSWPFSTNQSVTWSPIWHRSSKIELTSWFLNFGVNSDCIERTFDCVGEWFFRSITPYEKCHFNCEIFSPF